MLLDLNLPSFDTIMYNSKLQFTDSLNRCNNNLVKLYRALSETVPMCYAGAYVFIV